MHDPHVKSLRYRLETDESLAFQGAPPVEMVTPEFHAQLADGILTCTMKEHYATSDEARLVVDPKLRAWQISVGLKEGHDVCWFVYQDAKVEDMISPPSNDADTDVVVCLRGVETVSLADKLNVHVTRGTYPKPPEKFITTPNVESMWERYLGYKAGREPLPSMAYFCLTVVQNDAGGRTDAVQKFNIDRKVLDTLGDLFTIQSFSDSLCVHHTHFKTV